MRCLMSDSVAVDTVPTVSPSDSNPGIHVPADRTDAKTGSEGFVSSNSSEARVITSWLNKRFQRLQYFLAPGVDKCRLELSASVEVPVSTALICCLR